MTLPAGETTTIADIDDPGVIRHIWLTIGEIRGEDTPGDWILRDLAIRMYWDAEDDPSVEAPLGDFFCNGHGMLHKIESEPIVTVPYAGFNSYFRMPFAEGARIEIENDHPEDVLIYFTIDYALNDVSPETPYFHAQWRRENPTTPTEDFTIVDRVEGNGHYVGTYLAWPAIDRHWWGEGEVKFYIDGDEEYPTICGTGTEDYVGGSHCFWDGESHRETRDKVDTFSTPYLGYILPEYGPHAGDETYNGMYRFHIPDPIRFREDLKVTVQQISASSDGHRERSYDVSGVAYWYQQEPHAEFPEFPDRADRVPR
ncbi:glycoside hydrolase family 172 protein [Halocatena marina]|uniref:Glycoside hydrolase family 172 protein n=2 Tax=Halocatena marina TaxID=2934937 RepID=A0ABD5YZP7_9EURY